METFISYDLFISHVWHNSIEYNRIVEILNDAPNFYWRNYSSREIDPMLDLNSEYGKIKLLQQLEDQIKHVNLLVICADLHTLKPFWIEQEIAIAGKYKKPFIVVKPYGSDKTSGIISVQARELVGWDTNALVAAIRKHAS
jgi:hypothetical protein